MDLYQLTSNWVTGERLATKISKRDHQTPRWLKQKNLLKKLVKKSSIPTQPSFFRGYVSFGEGTVMYSQYIEYLSPICWDQSWPTWHPTSSHRASKGSYASSHCICQCGSILHYPRTMDPLFTCPLVAISNHTNWRDDDNWTPCGNSKWNDGKIPKSTIFVVLIDQENRGLFSQLS